jgi:hypothetical protein
MLSIFEVFGLLCYLYNCISLFKKIILIASEQNHCLETVASGIERIPLLLVACLSYQNRRCEDQISH